MSDQSAAPATKVVASSVGAAAATVAVILFSAITNNDVPLGLEGALATLFAFAAGYITPSRGGTNGGE